MKEDWFKADNSQDGSKEIVVSFSSRWRADLENGDIRYVFRKRIPKSFAPKRMYIYIGSPFSLFIGRAQIISTGEMSLRAASEVRADAKISYDELSKYYGSNGAIGFYELGPIELLKQPLERSFVARKTGFHPPQSFVHASREASAWLKAHFKGPPNEQ